MNTDLAAKIAKLPTPIVPTDKSKSTCPKCAGSRKFRTFSPYTGQVSYVGKCFECDGTGAVDARRVENSKAARQRTGIAIHTVETIIMLAVHEGNDDRAEFYLQRVVREDMFYVGKRNARRILDAIGSGRWLDDYSMSETWGERGAVDADVAAKWRARAVEIGRELREASESKVEKK